MYELQMLIIKDNSYFNPMANKCMGLRVPTLKASSHGSQVLNSNSLEVNPCNLNYQEHGSWGLPPHTGSQVQHGCLLVNIIWKVRLGALCLRVGPKTRPNSQHKVLIYSLHKITRSHKNHILTCSLRLKRLFN